MKATVLECKLILRHLDRVTGITETSRSFATLDELYSYCVATPDPHLVDRIVIIGQDEQGRSHLLTFRFQSISDYR